MKPSRRARSLGSIFTVLLGLQIVVATVAYAHHPIVGGSIACDHVQGKQVITWTVQNSETTSGSNRSMTVVGLSVSSGTVVGLALNDVLPPQPTAGSLVMATTTLPGTQTGDVTLSVTGSWNNGGPQNVLATKPVTLPGGCFAPPSLHITKTADAASVNASDTIGFKITVTNNGDGDAYGVSMTDALPSNSGLSWTIADNGGATCNIASGTLTCTKGTLASGAHFTVHVTSPTTSGTCGTVENSASVATTNDGKGSDSASVIVQCPNISISKSADAGSVTGGDPIGFTITASNRSAEGTGTAKDVTVTDTLPTNAGVSWSITPPVEGCSISSGVLTCTFGDLAPGESASVHISSPTTSEACGATVDNTAMVTAGNGSGGQDSASVEITCSPLGINLTKGGPDFAHVGDTIHYTMTVTNATSEPLLNVVVTDLVCNSTPLFTGGDTGNDGILTLGETWTYSCDHVVTANDPDPLPNTAHVTAIDRLQRPTGAQASHSVDILHPSIAIVKTANPLAGAPGDPVTYTYVVTNTSKDTMLYNITVTDDKLGNIGVISSLAPGASKTLTKTTTMPTSAGQLTNVGTATGADPLGKKVSDTDNATVSVVLAVRLPRTGTETRFPAEAGFVFLGIGLLFVGIARKRESRPAEEIAENDM